MPGIAPSTATPAKQHASTARTPSAGCDRCAAGRAISNRPIADRDDHGGERRCRQVLEQVGRDSSSAAIASAPTTPVSCVFAPAASATGVRDELLLTGKPWNKPAARLAAPSPTISWFGSTGVREPRGIHARQHARVGERDQRDRDAARGATGPTSSKRDPRESRAPAGLAAAARAPTRPRASPRSNSATTSVAPTTAIRIAGHARPALQQRGSARARRRRSRARRRFVSPVERSPRRSPRPVAAVRRLDREAEQLRAAGSAARSARCRSCSRSGSASTAAR